MGIEKIKELNEEQKDLMDLKKEVEEKDKPGIVNYIGESSDKKFDIYRYTVATGGNKGGIKNKYINQIGSWIEGTQFTDVNGNQINKDRFNEGEIVYLRVPKNNETKNIPGKIEYIESKKDKENRDWKWYSYTFAQGGTINGVMNKWESQIGKDNQEVYFDYCDKNGNKLKKERFGKGETIYIRKPNTDIIDPTPDMTIDEIMSISDNDLQDIFEDSNKLNHYNREDEWRYSKYVMHMDNLGEYMIINGKKVYKYSKNAKVLNEKAFMDYDGEDYSTLAIRIIKKDGNKYRGVENEDGDIYRGEFKKDGNIKFISAKYK